jgi:tRNA-dihydrouridine synthase
MAELSHRALRELIEGFGGCDEYFTEMISAAALLGKGPFERWYIEGGPCPERLVYQIVGSDAEQIARAAALLDRLECRGIDLNMGCSAPLIRKTGAGVTWMASVDQAGNLVKKVRGQVKRRLSAKIRIGFTDDFEYLVRFCRRLEEEGVELITLHPRTAKEKFKRSARWGYVSALRQELQIPVVGNGDITSAEGLLAMTDAADALMIGRAAVRQPWIFAQVKNVLKNSSHQGTKAQREERGDSQISSPPSCLCAFVWNTSDEFILETGLRFLELLARWQPPEFHISRAQRFFGFFCDNLKWGNYLKNLLNREKTLSGIKRAWQEYFNLTTNH